MGQMESASAMTMGSFKKKNYPGVLCGCEDKHHPNYTGAKRNLYGKKLKNYLFSAK